MPTEADIIDQLAGYCDWLEVELGVPMHRRRVVVPRRPTSASRDDPSEIVTVMRVEHAARPRGPLVPSLVAVALLFVGVTAVYQLRRDHHRSPLLEPSIDTVATDSSVPSSTALSVLADSWAPKNLPDNLVVWDVGWSRSGGTYGAPFTEQLFGRYDPTDTTLEQGLLVRIQDSVDDVLPADSNPRVTVRGQLGWVFNADPSASQILFTWVEQGREISVQGRGMSLDDAVAMLDTMQWRADGSASFEPSSTTLPLISEEASGAEFVRDQINFSITDLDGPTPVTGPLGAQVSASDAANVIVVEVGALILGSLRPELIFGGIRRADGSNASGTTVVEPDGTVVRILGASIDDDPATTDAILHAVSPITGLELRDMINTANDRVIQQPEVMASEFPGGRIVLRGGTAEWPLAICLELVQFERCRSTAGLHQFSSWQNGVLVDGRWFIVGRQPASDPGPVVYPWTTDLALQFPKGTVYAPTQSQVVDDQLLWYAEIPPGIDAVGVGYLNGDTVVNTTPTARGLMSAIRRPDS